MLSNIESYIENESEILSLIKEKKGNPLACIRGCGYLYEFKASECLLFCKDIETFKQYIC